MEIAPENPPARKWVATPSRLFLEWILEDEEDDDAEEEEEEEIATD